MFAVGKDGVNAALIISDGKFNAPSIYKVYHIGLNNETDIEIVGDIIYESEKNSGWSLQSFALEDVYGSKIVGVHTVNDYETFQELSRKQKGTVSKRTIRFDSELQDGNGSNSKTGIKETGIDKSGKASLEDGVFLMRKTQIFR